MSSRWRRGFAVATVLAEKDLKIAWSYRTSFVLGHFGVFGTIVMFYFVSRVVGQSEVVGGPQEYFRFVVIGMIVSGVIDTTVGAAVSAARSDQVQGTLEAIAALPVSSTSLGLGWMLYPSFDALIGMAVMTLMALPLGLAGLSPSWPELIVALTLTAVIFTGIGLLGAALVVAFQQGAGVIRTFLAVLALISGTLFPVSVMPAWLQTIADCSPLKHALDAVRGAALDSASFADLSSSFIALTIFAAVLLPVGIVGLERGFGYARQTGGLSRY